MDKYEFPILLVEDDELIARSLRRLFGEYDLTIVDTLGAAKARLAERRFALIFLDLGLPDGFGGDLLEDMQDELKETDVVILTANTDVDAAVKVMKLGAKDYIRKPFQKEDILLSLKRAREKWELRNKVSRLESELYEPFRFENIVAESPAMMKVFDVARKMALSDTNVMITGESGTGKELFARAIHSEGRRRHGPFVAVNCAQFSESLLESELFGHEKGAFTGAAGLRKGRFEMADGGTLFLDEIGNTSTSMQAKILRAVETQTFERVGGEASIRVNVRILSATNVDVEECVAKGKFREDLYYRLNVVRIEVPPLRERPEDIEPLCRHFLKDISRHLGKRVQGISDEALESLKAYEWPGNVRELENVIEMGIALEDGDTITLKYLPDRILAAEGASWVRRSSGNVMQHVLNRFERIFLIEQLRLHGWNQAAVAEALGVHRNTVKNRMNHLGIQSRQSEAEAG